MIDPTSNRLSFRAPVVTSAALRMRHMQQPYHSATAMDRDVSSPTLLMSNDSFSIADGARRRLLVDDVGDDRLTAPCLLHPSTTMRLLTPALSGEDQGCSTASALSEAPIHRSLFGDSTNIQRSSLDQKPFSVRSSGAGMSTASIARSLVAAHGQTSVQRDLAWQLRFDVHAPTRVLDAFGISDDAYTQPMSWGTERVAVLMEGQVLLFDAAHPTDSIASFDLVAAVAQHDGGFHRTGSSSSNHTKTKLTAVAIVPDGTERAVLVGDSKGNLRLIRFPQQEETASAKIERTWDLSCVGGFSTIPSATRAGHISGDIHWERVAAAVASATSRGSAAAQLQDMTTTSIASIAVCEQHPTLCLVASACGRVALIDIHIPHRPHAVTPVLSEILATRASSSAQTHASSTHQNRRTHPGNCFTAGGEVGDRVVSVAWNCTGSLFACGTNSSGVFVFSASNLSCPTVWLPAPLFAGVALAHPHSIIHQPHTATGSIASQAVAPGWVENPITFESDGSGIERCLGSHDRSLPNGPGSRGDGGATGVDQGNGRQYHGPSASSFSSKAPQHPGRVRCGEAATRALAFHPRNPFELAYGGGLGDGTIRVINIATLAYRYTIATGTQIAALAYSPCGSFLVSTHGFRRADTPQQPLGGGAGGGSTEAHLTYLWGGVEASPSTATTTAGPALQPSSLAASLAPTKFCIAIWSKCGGEKPSPASLLHHSAASAASNRHLPASSLMSSRSSSCGSIDDGDSTGSLHEPFGVPLWADDDVSQGSVKGPGSTAGVATTAPPSSQSSSGCRTLRMIKRLDGHTARPLHLVCPRLSTLHARSGSQMGFVATGAGGSDGTIRLWHVFRRPHSNGGSAGGSEALLSSLSSDVVGGLPVPSAGVLVERSVAPLSLASINGASPAPLSLMRGSVALEDSIVGRSPSVSSRGPLSEEARNAPYQRGAAAPSWHFDVLR